MRAHILYLVTFVVLICWIIIATFESIPSSINLKAFPFLKKTENKNPTIYQNIPSYMSLDLSPSSIIITTSDMHNFTVDRNQRASVVFMSPTFDRYTFDFARKLAQDSTLAVYILVDAINVDSISRTDDGVYLVSTSSSPAQYGFKLTDGFNVMKEVHTWDKALYLFSKVFTHYDFVWLIEYDVFIPTISTFYDLHKTFVLNSAIQADLIVANHMPNYDGHLYKVATTVEKPSMYRSYKSMFSSRNKSVTWDWHWQRINGRMTLPWFGSMMCATGISSKLLIKVAEYAAAVGRLEFIEIFLNTLAAHNNLTVVNPEELSTILFRHEWSCDQILENTHRWYHPVKDKSGISDCWAQL